MLQETVLEVLSATKTMAATEVHEKVKSRREKTTLASTRSTLSLLCKKGLVLSESRGRYKKVAKTSKKTSVAKAKTPRAKTTKQTKSKSSAASEFFIKSYGEKWARKNFENKEFHLVGKKDGSKPQYFDDKKGVYVLYQGNTPKYVGMTKASGFSARLKAHTKSAQLRNEWNYFSFFEIGGAASEEAIANIESILMAVLSTYIVNKQRPYEKVQVNDLLGS